MSVAPLTLGASQAAAACGIDPFCSPMELALRMRGEWPERDTEATHFGTLLQPVVRDETAARGYEFMPAPADGFRDPEREWLVGHPDALYAEFKTHNPFVHRNGGAALHDEAQCQVYMHLTDQPSWTLATLVGGSRLDVVTVERNDDAIGFMLALCEQFMATVQAGRLPDVDASESTRDALRLLYPDAMTGKVLRASKALMAEHVKPLRVIHETQARLKEQRAKHEHAIQAAMGDSQVLISPYDDEVVRWANVQTKRLNQSALKSAHPAIAAEFSEPATTRPFKLVT